MNQILTNKEIAQVVHDIDCAEVRPFDIEFARAIEAAILAKLNSAEPVGESNTFFGAMLYGELPIGTKLFTHPPAPSVVDAFPQAHRLALELECLILDCKDNVAVSRWWDSANEALDQWREFCTTDAQLAAARSEK